MSLCHIKTIALEIVQTQEWIQNHPAFPKSDTTANDCLTINNTVTNWCNILNNSTHVPSCKYNYQLFQNHITNPKALCLPVQSFPVEYDCNTIVDDVKEDLLTEHTSWDSQMRIKYKYVTTHQIHSTNAGGVVIEQEDLFHNVDLDSDVAVSQFNIYQSTFPAVFVQKGGSVSRFHVDAVHGASYLHSGRKLWLCVPFDMAQSLLIHNHQYMIQTRALDADKLRQCGRELQWFVQEAGETVLVNPWCCHAVITFNDDTPAVLVSNNHIWRSAFQLTVAFNRVFKEPDFTPSLRKRTADTMELNNADPELIQQWIKRKKSQHNSWLIVSNTNINLFY